MPELPEVETIAGDLRGLVTGARIVGASCNWPPTLRSHDAGAFARGVADREIEGVGRRGKQLLIWLGPSARSDRPGNPPDDDPIVLTVHLKMTGQLFVVPADTPRDRHVHLVLSLADGRELWSYEIGGSLTSSPAISGGMIVIASDDGSVYAFGGKQ